MMGLVLSGANPNAIQKIKRKTTKLYDFSVGHKPFCSAVRMPHGESMEKLFTTILILLLSAIGCDSSQEKSECFGPNGEWITECSDEAVDALPCHVPELGCDIDCRDLEGYTAESRGFRVSLCFDPDGELVNVCSRSEEECQQ